MYVFGSQYVFDKKLKIKINKSRSGSNKDSENMSMVKDIQTSFKIAIY